MKIRRLERLFETLSNPINNQAAKPVNADAENRVSAGDDAVSVASGLSDQERAERVRKLKEQVSAGTYQPDSRAVAQAVVRDLFA